MRYLWKSFWYKVSIQEKDGKVSGRAEWDDHGRFREFDFPPKKMPVEKVLETLIAQMEKVGTGFKWAPGSTNGFHHTQIIDDHGRRIRL